MIGIEKFSVLRSLQAIEQSDVCLLLMDVSEHSTALDQKIAGLIKEAGKGLIIVVSKWDKLKTLEEAAPEAAEEAGDAAPPAKSEDSALEGEPQEP